VVQKGSSTSVSAKQKCENKLSCISSVNFSSNKHDAPACVPIHMHNVTSVKSTHIKLEGKTKTVIVVSVFKYCKNVCCPWKGYE